MLLAMSIACLFIGIYAIYSTAKSLKTGIIKQEDGYELRRKKNPLQFRMSIMAVRIFGSLMILLSMVLLAGAFFQNRGLQ
jgi:uncharacterized membrane protein